MEQLKHVMQAGIDGTLTTTEFQSLARARKDIYLYRLSMEPHLSARGQDVRIAPFWAAFRRRRRTAGQESQNTEPAS